MAQVTSRGELRIFIRKSFEKDGENVEYFTGYFLTADADGNDDVLVVNTKKDLSEFEGKTGDIHLSINNGKLSLVAFKV